jgi:hypothetical protein
MIIILEPQKDTYVTNLKTINNDGSKANVGQAATLDLFKLYNENKYSHSWASFKFASGTTIPNGSTLVLADTDGNEKTFEFDSDNPESITAGRIRINIHEQNSNVQYAATIATVINAVSDLNITAYNNSNNELVLKQDKPGALGDTTFTLPPNMVHSGGASVTKFARIDYSSALLKFDLVDFKQSWSIGNDLSQVGAFNNLTAHLILKDITTGITKPKDFQLTAFKLLKEFEEGLGKDTIHFSDSDICNFESINNNSTNNTWDISSYITKHSSGDIASLNTSDPLNTFNLGNEDLSLEITAYIKEQIAMATPDDKGILIKFPDSLLFNNKSYFAKRFGSRHLLNKKLIPQLQIKINDASYHIPANSFNKERFLGKNEKIYLYNSNSGNYTTSFNKPNDRCNLKFRIKSSDENTTLINDNATSDVENFSGTILTGIKETLIKLDRFNTTISSLIKNNVLKTKTFWYWLDESDPDKLTSAGSFIAGKRYKINTSTNTNFVAIGAENNDIGTIFTATGIGSGDNNAYELVEYQVISQDINFKNSEQTSEVDFKNLISSITIDENNIDANDSVTSFKVYFIDTRKEFDSVKTPYQLPSENLGNINYSVIDVESGKTLIDYDDSATLLFFDGEKYIFDFYVPKMFKNMRINFKFKYKDVVTNVDKFIHNKKYSIRIM